MNFCLYRGGGGGGGGWRAAQDRDQIYRYAREGYKSCNSRNSSHEGSITSLLVVKLCGIAQDWIA